MLEQSENAAPESVGTPIKACRIDDAARALSISRRQLYRELKAGRLQGKKMGAVTLIPIASIDNWLRSLPDMQGEQRQVA